MVATQLRGQNTNITQTGHITPNSKQRKTRIQQIVGTLLYYARAFYPTILVDLVSIASNQINSNETTTQSIKQLLDHCDTYPNTTIRYK